MRKILTILLAICYSCTLFSQKYSMNDITKLEQKIDSVDNLIRSLDSINYPVPVSEDKLSQLERRHESAIQEYYAMNNFKPSIYKTDRNRAIKAISIMTLCTSPILGAALLSSDDIYTETENYAIAGCCFIGVPITAVSAFLISNNRYRKSQKDWGSYRAKLNSKSAEINLLDDRIKEEKENIKVLRSKEYRTRKSNLQEERVCLIKELNEALVENGCVDYDTITKVENNYFDYNSEYLFKNDLISKKSFSIILDTLGYHTTLNYYDKSLTKTVTLNITKKIRLKKGKYFYTTTDTVRIGNNNKFGNYRYIDIPIRFEYNINYNEYEYEITKRTYKNNKLIGTLYFNNIAEAVEDEKEETKSIKKELFIYYREY